MSKLGCNLGRSQDRRRLTLRLKTETYDHFEASALKGGYRSVAAVIAHLCDCVALRGRILKDKHPEDVKAEIESMFEFYSHEGRD